MRKVRGTIFLFTVAMPILLCLHVSSAQEENTAVQSSAADISVGSAGSFKETPSDPVGTQEPSAIVSPAIEKKIGADDLISVNFENVDIRDVIRILADKGQVNMVVGPDVSATVNLQLNNVTWNDALDVILKTYNLTYKRDGDLIRVMTLEQLQHEDEKVPVATKIVTLNFARASEVKGNFTNMLSSRGRIDVNDRTNSLIVTDIPDNIKRIEEIANKLDTRTPQVMIEALMADVKITQEDQLGINWNIKQEQHGDSANAGASGGSEKSFVQNLGSLAATGGALAFGTTILTDKDLFATIAAWQQQSRVNILAHPRIMTLDNLPARVNLTEEIPYQQQTQTTQSQQPLVTTSFKEAGIALTVTPHITTKDNYIYLNLDVKESFESRRTNDGQPVIDSRSAATNLLVRNHETAVIGGLRKKNDTFTLDKVPVLGDIPLIGSAFRKRVGSLSDTDLMIFVTPSIVEEVVLTEKERIREELFNEETEDWAQRFNKTKHRNIPRPRQEEKITEYKTTGSASEPDGHFYLRPPRIER